MPKCADCSDFCLDPSANLLVIPIAGEHRHQEPTACLVRSSLLLRRSALRVAVVVRDVEIHVCHLHPSFWNTGMHSPTMAVVVTVTLGDSHEHHDPTPVPNVSTLHIRHY